MATQALEDALNIIEILRKEYIAGVSELSKKLKLNKNKVFRIMATLELKGIVELDEETGKYRLGMNLIKLEHAYIKSLEFLNKAKQSIRVLRQEIDESVYIAIPHRKDVIYIYEEPVRKSVIVESPLAKRFRADKTATGRVLKRAKKEIGFIVEYEIGLEVNEVATIVRDEFYYPIASLSVIAPSVRMPLERIKEDIQQKLVETAEEITEILAPTFSLD